MCTTKSFTLLSAFERTSLFEDQWNRSDLGFSLSAEYKIGNHPPFFLIDVLACGHCGILCLKLFLNSETPVLSFRKELVDYLLHFDSEDNDERPFLRDGFNPMEDPVWEKFYNIRTPKLLDQVTAVEKMWVPTENNQKPLKEDWCDSAYYLEDVWFYLVARKYNITVCLLVEDDLCHWEGFNSISERSICNFYYASDAIHGCLGETRCIQDYDLRDENTCFIYYHKNHYSFLLPRWRSRSFFRTLSKNL